MICLQLVHELRQSIWGCSVPYPNWKDDWSQLLGWVSYDECTSVYNYTLGEIYSKL